VFKSESARFIAYPHISRDLVKIGKLVFKARLLEVA